MKRNFLIYLTVFLLAFTMISCTNEGTDAVTDTGDGGSVDSTAGEEESTVARETETDRVTEPSVPSGKETEKADPEKPSTPSEQETDTTAGEDTTQEDKVPEKETTEKETMEKETAEKETTEKETTEKETTKKDNGEIELPKVEF